MQAWVYNGVEFKVGDRVKIVSDAVTDDPNGMGANRQWRNSWVRADEDSRNMDAFIGLEFVIEDIDAAGVYFGDKESGYGFPLSCMINLSAKGSLPTIQQKEVA